MRLPGNSIFDIALPVSDQPILLLMLPGAKNSPQQLLDYGFIRALRERGLPVDVLILDAHVDLYLERADIEALLQQTLDEVRASGYRRVWLLGISLGGTGAMLCATQPSTEIEGVLLLAPFLGTRGIIAEVEAAGGLHHWQAGEIGSRDYERALLERLRQSPPGTTGFPPVFLGYGGEDHYRGASNMLAAYLPEQHVCVIPGGHDWETWQLLWQNLLDRNPFNLSA